MNKRLYTNAEIATIAQYIDRYPTGWTFDQIVSDLDQGSPYGDIEAADFCEDMTDQEVARLMKHTVKILEAIYGN